jgi:hypothetical protein
MYKDLRNGKKIENYSKKRLTTDFLNIYNYAFTALLTQ